MSSKHDLYEQDDQLEMTDQAEHDYDDVDYDDPEAYGDDDEYDDEFEDESTERRLLKSWEGRLSMALLLSLGLTLGGVMIYRMWGDADTSDGTDPSVLGASADDDPADESNGQTPGGSQLAGVGNTSSTAQSQVVTPQPLVGQSGTAASDYPGHYASGTSPGGAAAYTPDPAMPAAYGTTASNSGTGAYGAADNYGTAGADSGYPSAGSGGAYSTAGTGGYGTTATDTTAGVMRLTTTTGGSSDAYTPTSGAVADAAPLPNSSVVEMVPDRSHASAGAGGMSATINVTASDPTSPMSGGSYQDSGQYAASGSSQYGTGGSYQGTGSSQYDTSGMYRQPSSGAAQVTTIPHQPQRTIETSGGYASSGQTYGGSSDGYSDQGGGYRSATHGAAYGTQVASSDAGFSTTTTQREYERMHGSGASSSAAFDVAPVSSGSGGTQFGSTGDGRYTVRPGENYWTISKKIYGVGNYHGALAEYNRASFPRENELDIGDVIETPSVEVLQRDFPDLCPSQESVRSITSRPDLNRQPAPMLGPGEIVYEVQSGDNLFDIARYELDDVRLFMKIWERNRSLIGDDYNFLTPGMKLVLPAKPGTIAAAPASSSSIRYAETPNYDTRRDYSSGSSAATGGYGTSATQGKYGSPAAGQYTQPSTGYQKAPATYPSHTSGASRTGGTSYQSGAGATPYRASPTYGGGAAVTQPEPRPATPSGGMWR